MKQDKTAISHVRSVKKENNNSSTGKNLLNTFIKKKNIWSKTMEAESNFTIFRSVMIRSDVDIRHLH